MLSGLPKVTYTHTHTQRVNESLWLPTEVCLTPNNFFSPLCLIPYQNALLIPSEDVEIYRLKRELTLCSESSKKPRTIGYRTWIPHSLQNIFSRSRRDNQQLAHRKQVWFTESSLIPYFSRLSHQRSEKDTAIDRKSVV